MMKHAQDPLSFGCIGEHLGHSFSKEIHALFADYSYDLCELAPDELAPFLAARTFRGINVTIPYKQAVIPLLDGVDEIARMIGAVNTVVNRNGRLIGYNTDFYGLSSLIGRIGVPLERLTVAILGSGGTSKTANAVARALGASTVLTVSRTPVDGQISYGELYTRREEIDYLINTTPSGMYPHPDGMAAVPDEFPSLKGLADAVYNPLRPRLVQAARACGVPASGGLYMLVAQAVRAGELFTDTTYPTGTVERIYRTLCRQKESLILVGMPASGKSTVGRLLAKSLGRPFLDCDTLIEEQEGCTIAEIFSTRGEREFRRLERAMLTEVLALRSGVVIATGGGAVLSAESIRALKQNGRVYFLDRPLEELIPTASRPTASTREAIEARYRERYPLYCGLCDRRIDTRGMDAEAVASAIGKDLEA